MSLMYFCFFALGRLLKVKLLGQREGMFVRHLIPILPHGFQRDGADCLSSSVWQGLSQGHTAIFSVSLLPLLAGVVGLKSVAHLQTYCHRYTTCQKRVIFPWAKPGAEKACVYLTFHLLLMDVCLSLSFIKGHEPALKKCGRKKEERYWEVDSDYLNLLKIVLYVCGVGGVQGVAVQPRPAWN
jgi:hypothetical protein